MALNPEGLSRCTLVPDDAIMDPDEAAKDAFERDTNIVS